MRKLEIMDTRNPNATQLALPWGTEAIAVDPQVLGMRVRQIRKQRKMKIVELAVRMGMNAQSGRVTLSRLERGETRNPGVDIIASVARALGVTTGTLLSDPPSYLETSGPVSRDEAEFLSEVLKSYRARPKK